MSALPEYIKAVYLRDYNLPTLECLVRNLGEEKAIEILESSCKRVQRYRLNGYPSQPYLIKKGYLGTYVNIQTLREEAMRLYSFHEGAAKFLDEALRYRDMYRKSKLRVVQDEMKNDRKERKITSDQYVFRACYYMAYIYRLSQREAIVKDVNKAVIDGKLQTYLALGTPSRARLHIPREYRWLDGFNEMIQYSLAYHTNDVYVEMVHQRFTIAAAATTTTKTTTRKSGRKITPRAQQVIPLSGSPAENVKMENSTKKRKRTSAQKETQASRSSGADSHSLIIDEITSLVKLLEDVKEEKKAIHTERILQRLQTLKGLGQ